LYEVNSQAGDEADMEQSNKTVTLYCSISNWLPLCKSKHAS